MKITATTMDRLTPDQRAAWVDYQRADPTLASPYFHPDFVRLAAARRGGVEVGVLEAGGEPVGFFPFERRGRQSAVPVAAPLNDFQAVVGRRGLTFDPVQLLRGCGLAVWRFSHLLAGQTVFKPYAWKEVPSAFMDLSRGFDAYMKQREEAGCTELAQSRRKTKKVENQVGPLRFVTHTVDDEAFRALARWKGEQYRRTSRANLFDVAWIVALLKNIRRHAGDDFAGLFSALYMGDRLAAVHLGMRYRNVLHAWFPAYDADLGRYSPGTILFCELARAAPGLGIDRIDLGSGPERFKLGLMSGSVPVAEGAVDLRGVARTFDRMRRSASQVIQTSPWCAPARAAARISRPLRQWMAIR